MPVFISYSHQDKSFVDEFAMELVRNGVHVWLDRWELKPGDSLLTNIESAVEGASALVVVLSKSSVKSAWCRQELTAGLVANLQNGRSLSSP